MCSLQCYFGVYFPRCCATREINTKITLTCAHQHLATLVHTLFYITGIPIQLRQHLYIEMGPSICLHQLTAPFWLMTSHTDTRGNISWQRWHLGQVNTLRPRQNGCHFADDILKMHCHQWKIIHFNWNYTAICSYGFNEQYFGICFDNGLAPIRRQAIIWTYDD